MTYTYVRKSIICKTAYNILEVSHLKHSNVFPTSKCFFSEIKQPIKIRRISAR